MNTTASFPGSDLEEFYSRFPDLDSLAEVNTYAGFRERHACESPISVPNTFLTARCNNRSAEQCGGCSDLYVGDHKRIAYSGVVDEDGHVAHGYDFWLVTRTLPSFGATHYVPTKWVYGKPVRKRLGKKNSVDDLCTACGSFHHPEHDRALAGQPVDMGTYDFEAHYQHNKHSYELFTADIKRLRRAYDDAETENPFGKLAYFGVKELQSRVAVHFHTIIRFPAGRGPRTDDEVKSALNGVQIESPDTGETLTWGTQFDVQHINEKATNKYGHTGHFAMIGYLLGAIRYTIKDAAAHPGHKREGLPFYQGYTDAERDRHRFLDLMTAQTYEDCEGCLALGAEAEEPCKSLRHERYGITNRPFMKSGNWSFTGLTRRRLKAERLAWVKARRAEQGRPMIPAADAEAVRAMGWVKSLAEHSIRMHETARWLRAQRGTRVAEQGTELYRLRAREKALSRKYQRNEPPPDS